MKNRREATKLKLFALFVNYNINIGLIVPDPE
ncbi:hypothetical protein CLV60_115190 [Dyadobacter jiangsuensis]|uniref:Uncharacterized protein n=1 Tax=Dyadobacter jiangsuensis TaxID=1591085 RepID=A0A2P8FQM4_9BACT|nr:hypothetical protein CLV60_115190 [Dyadobacter jiangsuensis]